MSGRRRKNWGPFTFPSADNGSSPDLWCPIISCIDDTCGDLEAHVDGNRLDIFELMGLKQAFDVFHQKNRCFGLLHDLHVCFPKFAASVAMPFFVQEAEALAWRSPDNDFSMGDRRLTIQPCINIFDDRHSSKISGVSRRCRFVELDRQKAVKPSTKAVVHKAQS